MDHVEEELQQIDAWCCEDGLAPEATKEAQLCFLWRAYQHARGQLSIVRRDLDSQRSQHAAEMAEVRKTLEQIRNFTEHKNVLAEAIQDENDDLKDQLRRLISHQDAQISEVAKMLYQQGLTELIPSSPSEQVAYLLVERASLLEGTREEADPSVTAEGNAASRLRTDAQRPDHVTHQSPRKGALHPARSPWRRLFGLHKASHSRPTLIPANRAERECSRLERDLEEGSRRLAMAHDEIRRLTEQLESAHVTQRTYEPELQEAQREVEQLRLEVEKVKKYEMVELRKAKELNDRLDFEVRALRGRVRSLDADNSFLQQTSKAAELTQKNQTCRDLREKLAAPTQCVLEKEETLVILQGEVKRLESALQERQQQLIATQVQADRAHELVQSHATELAESKEMCGDLQNELNAQTRSVLEHQSEIHALKQQLASCHGDVDLTACTREDSGHDQQSWRQTDHEDSFADSHAQMCEENPPQKESCGCRGAVRTLLATRAECETLRKEICQTLKYLDKERSRHHEKKEKYKTKFCQALQKFDDETTWRDERIKQLERELSLSSHSLAKEKELVRWMTEENEKLLRERSRLLQQLNEQEHDNKDTSLTASLSKHRVDFLEMENEKLGDKLLYMCQQLAALERTLHSVQSSRPMEHLEAFTSLPTLTPSGRMPEPTSLLPRETCASASSSAETSYLNLTSAQRRSGFSTPPTALSTCVPEINSNLVQRECFRHNS